jgi:hypothetical protein
MVWGAIGKGYKSELIPIKTVNAGSYQRMLIHYDVFGKMQRHYAAIGRPMPHFQQDGHRLRPQKRQLNISPETKSHSYGIGQHSPDLSPIENLWGILKRRVAIRELKNIDQVWCYLKREWERLDQGMIDQLMDSMYRRFQLCVENNGKCITHLLNQKKRLGDRNNPVIPSTLREVHIGKKVWFWGKVIHVNEPPDLGETLEIRMQDPDSRQRRLPSDIPVMVSLQFRERPEIGKEYYIVGGGSDARRPSETNVQERFPIPASISGIWGSP